MAIEHQDLSTDLRRVTLSGRLDFHGVEEIASQLSSLLSNAGRDALVDLTKATLICSMGIRALILNAKNVQQRGGRMALIVSEGSIVATTLKSVGLDTLLPLYTSLPAAQQAMQE